MSDRPSLVHLLAEYEEELHDPELAHLWTDYAKRHKWGLYREWQFQSDSGHVVTMSLQEIMSSTPDEMEQLAKLYGDKPPLDELQLLQLRSDLIKMLFGDKS